jgi:hypothetical protein
VHQQIEPHNDLYVKLLTQSVHKRLSKIFKQLNMKELLDKDYEELNMINPIPPNYDEIIRENDLYKYVLKYLGETKKFNITSFNEFYMFKLSLNTLTHIVQNGFDSDFYIRILENIIEHTYLDLNDTSTQNDNNSQLILSAYQLLLSIFKSLDKGDHLLNLFSYIDNANILNDIRQSAFKITKSNTLDNCIDHLQLFKPNCLNLLDRFYFNSTDNYLAATLMGEIIVFNPKYLPLNSSNDSNKTKILLLLHEFGHYKRFNYSANKYGYISSPDMFKNNKPEIGNYVEKNICVKFIKIEELFEYLYPDEIPKEVT